MKRIPFLCLIVVVVLCLSACKCDHDFPDKYYPGHVTIRAEDHYPTGMIKFDDVFDHDEELESPSRAIIYRVKDAAEDSTRFDLYDFVYFKIKCESGLQLAIDIRHSVDDSTQVASKAELYSILPHIQLNLHNGDMHREGPKHTRRHIIGVISVTPVAIPGNTNEYAIQVETREEGTMHLENFWIYQSEYNQSGSGPFYFEESGVMINNQQDEVHRISITHDHNL